MDKGNEKQGILIRHTDDGRTCRGIDVSDRAESPDCDCRRIVRHGTIFAFGLNSEALIAEVEKQHA